MGGSEIMVQFRAKQQEYFFWKDGWKVKEMESKDEGG
jgi:hypothetical protein